MIQWKAVGKKKVPEPVPGLDENFDRANNRVERIKHEIENYIEIPRKDMKNKGINFTMGS